MTKLATRLMLPQTMIRTTKFIILSCKAYTSLAVLEQCWNRMPALLQHRLCSHADPPWSGFDCLSRIFEGFGHMALLLVEHILTALL